MFHDRSLAKLLPTVAFAALALCFAQGALPFPEETSDPGAPPSEFPEHSGEMNEFGSKFEFSFSQGAGDFVPHAVIDCNTCSFPVNPDNAHTFTLAGRVLGYIRGDDGVVVPSSAGVYNMNITITGVKATVSEPVDAGDGFSEQTIKYTADLTGAEPFKAAVSGTLVLDTEATPQPDPLPNGTTITVGAETGVTPNLETGASATFPAISSSNPGALGQEVPANVVFQITETKRLGR